MKLITKYMFVLMIVSLITSCNKNEDEISSKQTDVYAVGTSNGQGTLWKNGVPTTLSSNFSNATCVFVNGNDVYIGGTSNNKATIWKNNVPIILPNTSSAYRSEVKSIFVSGNDVYAVGNDKINQISFTYGKIWKNSIEIPLLPNCDYATSVTVQGTDVFVTGSKNNQAILWKNGNSSNLTSISSNSIANLVFSLNNDVYVCGYETLDSFRNPRLWKNGEIVPFSNPTINGIAKSVFVLGNDVYVVGYKLEGSKQLGVLWKNGNEIEFNGGSTYQSIFNSLFVLENDVFIVGNEDYGTHSSGAFWTNGNSTQLSYGTDSNCNSVFVTRK